MRPYATIDHEGEAYLTGQGDPNNRWPLPDGSPWLDTARMLQASQLDALVKKTVKAGPIHTDLPILDEGELMLLPSGVRSSTLGALDFMTPIGESPLDEVTQAEADAYRAWAKATPSKKMLERSIDRRLSQEKARAEGKPAPPAAEPWLGSNVALRVNRKILEVVNTLQCDQYRRAMQRQCWANLPILNEWKRLYPDRDPVKVHQQVWGVELVCPGGGKYLWNDQYRSMASTIYGHPGQPKDGPPAPPMLSSFAAGSFGLTFENQGLHARAELSRGEEKTRGH